jgi:hypothetical protein
MVPALHSSKYLFSIFHSILRNMNMRRKRLPALAKLALYNWRTMLEEVHRCPVPITYFVPHAPQYYCAVDASKDGMGGWWIPTILVPSSPPFLWKLPWPPALHCRLVSASNTSGDLTINDLELVAVVAGHHILHTTCPSYLHTHIVVATDNTAAQAWLANARRPRLPHQRSYCTS